MTDKVRVGDKAPDFTLPSQNGDNLNFRDLIGKKEIVLYFYPKDFTRGCTKEACAFRDNFETFTRKGAEVIGISSDSVGIHHQFASIHKLPFTLLADEEGKVRRLFGVTSTLGMIPGRATYVIDRSGIVRHIHNSQFRSTSHVDKAIAVLDIIWKENARTNSD